MMRVLGTASFALVTLTASAAVAQDVRLTETRANATFSLNGQTFTIARVQDQSHRLTGDYTRTSRACPPACIQPMSAARGVDTGAELELLDFLKSHVEAGSGLLIDARLPGAFSAAAIPGAVNVPSRTVDLDNPYRPDILRALGAIPVAGGQFDFSGALDLMIYCDGPWSGTSRVMIRNLLDAGYPPEKITYYRAGMQGWVSLGLATARPQNQG